MLNLFWFILQMKITSQNLNLKDSCLVFASHDAIESRHVLPNYLLGLDRHPQVQVGSVLQQFVNRVLVKSSFSFGRTQWALEITQLGT